MAEKSRKELQSSIERKSARRMARIAADAAKRRQLQKTKRSSPHEENERTHDHAQASRRNDASTPPAPPPTY